MKTTIDKSKVMKRAWNIFRGKSLYSYSFSDSLSRAWFVEKEAIAYAQRKAEELVRKESMPVISGFSEHSPEFEAGIVNYYKNAPARTYFGD